jgi:hypothetical protein
VYLFWSMATKPRPGHQLTHETPLLRAAERQQRCLAENATAGRGARANSNPADVFFFETTKFDDNRRPHNRANMSEVMRLIIGDIYFPFAAVISAGSGRPG